MQLRHIEKKLVLQKKYGDATGMKKFADDLQCQEECYAQGMLEQKMKGDFVKLREKYDLMFRTMEAHYEALLQEMRVKMQRDLDRIQNAMGVIEGRQKVQKGKRQSALSKKPSTLPDVETVIAIHTPRTAEKLAKFRNENLNSFHVSPVKDDIIAQLPPSPGRGKRRLRNQASSRFPKLTQPL
jgi:hypothetical protein